MSWSEKKKRTPSKCKKEKLEEVGKASIFTEVKESTVSTE